MMKLTIADDAADEELSSDSSDYTTLSSEHNQSISEKQKSRAKELEELKARLTSLENTLTDQSLDIDNLRANVNGVSEAKVALLKERQMVLDTDEKDLLTPLEQKIGEMEITLKKQIEEAKDEILTFTEKSGRDRGQELEQLEKRLTRHLLRLTSEETAMKTHQFTQSCIQQNFVPLLDDIDPDAVLDYLYQELFTFDEYERIRSQKTKKDKNRMLLVYVDKKGREGTRVLRAALKRVEYLENLCEYFKEDTQTVPVCSQL